MNVLAERQAGEVVPAPLTDEVRERHARNSGGPPGGRYPEVEQRVESSTAPLLHRSGRRHGHRHDAAPALQPHGWRAPDTYRRTFRPRTADPRGR
jgi:hypothetical protein